MRTYTFTVGGQTYVFEAATFAEARAKLKELITDK
jgi:hypothetical protein